MTTPVLGSSPSATSQGRRSQPVPRLGHISFPCSDCSLTFPTHQALGGHRKFHTKLLDPNLRKLLRRQRRKVSVNAANVALPTIVENNQMPQEKKEWHTVEVKISDDDGMNGGGSNAGGKFVEFVETGCEQSTAGGPFKEAIQMELDLTLHL